MMEYTQSINPELAKRLTMQMEADGYRVVAIGVVDAPNDYLVALALDGDDRTVLLDLRVSAAADSNLGGKIYNNHLMAITDFAHALKG